jgi:hypothetical protein
LPKWFLCLNYVIKCQHELLPLLRRVKAGPIVLKKNLIFFSPWAGILWSKKYSPHPTFLQEKKHSPWRYSGFATLFFSFRIEPPIVRIRSKNRNFEMEIADPFVHKKELDNLYDKYLGSIDFDGYSSIEKATFKRGSSNIYQSRAIIIRDGIRIVSCGIFHTGITSAASILHFFDPEYKQFSPGKYLILKTLDYCKLHEMEWYYPGYIIKGNRKMDYKLFLGKEIAQYYHPEPDYLSGSWLSFRSDLCLAD